MLDCAFMSKPRFKQFILRPGFIIPQGVNFLKKADIFSLENNFLYFFQLVNVL